MDSNQPLACLVNKLIYIIQGSTKDAPGNSAGILWEPKGLNLAAFASSEWCLVV